jgi:hypothetical protein
MFERVVGVCVMWSTAALVAHPVQCPWFPFVSFKHGLLQALVLRNEGTRANENGHLRIGWTSRANQEVAAEVGVVNGEGTDG